MSENRHMMKKMCVIGEAAVGKTSLIRRFVHDKFDDSYIATIGTKTTAKEIQIATDDEIAFMTLQIWDILGVRSFSKLQKIAYKGANGAFIVVDITRKVTFRTFDSWLSSLYKIAGDIPVVVLANKNDLNPDIGKVEIERFISDYGFPYYLTSAKTGQNVNNAFNNLGQMMVKPWVGTKIDPQLEISDTTDTMIEPELASSRKLSIFEVEDIIMARYCELLEDQDFAMAIIRQQFNKAELDFMYPTISGLSKVVDLLMNAASDRVENTRLEKERKAYTHLIKMIG
ncbi:MAG: GTP-binding protein [Methanomassiliicoccales archaeon]|nr:MAG: GTP-binding protein [Methanomassiliicoccales archaeon]